MKGSRDEGPYPTGLGALFPRRAEAGPLRIALVAPPFLPVPPPGYGGIERVVSLLADGLVASGHDVTLFAAPGSATSAQRVTPLEQAPVLGDPASVADDLFHVTAAYLRAAAFDVIHDHTGFGPSLGAVLDNRSPVVHTLHGPWTPRARRLFGLIDRRVHLVAISRAQRDANPGLRYAGVVYNGVDLRTHPVSSRKEDFLVYVGRVSPEKRPEIAVEVARRARRPLVMVVKRSEPSEQEYWETVVAPRLDRTVTVLDQPPHAVKVDALRRAAAMVFPIDWPEPFGLVMAEAMACGTPVIARPLGAAPEVVDDGVTGFLRSTVDGMVEALDALGTLDPLACRRRVERLFSADAMVRGYQRLYRAAVDAADHRSAGRGIGDAADHRSAGRGIGDAAASPAGAAIRGPGGTAR